MILGPEEIVPDENNLLNLQARFVTRIHPLLLPLYVSGAFLTMLGTLYGTIEIACAIADEIVRSFFSEWTDQRARRLRRVVLCWCAPLALSVLGWLFIRQSGPIERPETQVTSSTDSLESDSTVAASGSISARQGDTSVRKNKPRLLLAILTPVNLFTGVLACGLVCFVIIWMDRRWLPAKLQPPIWLTAMNVVSAAIFFGLGVKGYWDNENRIFVVSCLTGIFALAMIAAAVAGPKLQALQSHRSSTQGDRIS